MIRLALRVDRAHAEVALAELLELAPGGVEEVDLGDAGIEYAVYGPPGELPALPDLEAAVGGALVEVTTRELPDDWSERWKQFHHPLVLDGPDGPRLAVRPPWEQPIGAAVELVIDPAQAFGTGAHATTRLCLELLQEREPTSLLDVGCGSGVLSIAAVKLGFAPVGAFDLDDVAMETTTANAEANGAAVDVLDELRPAALAVMNIALDVVEGLLPKLSVERAIVSGYLDRDVPSAAGWQRLERRVRDGWAADLLEFRP